VIQAEKLGLFSFQPPFEEIDPAGNRIAGPHWRNSGVAVVNKNFIRLTPDRQSKKGAIWSRRSIDVPSFSAILQFRISGQGRTFFGDGIGFWLVQSSFFQEGPVHGFIEQFVGVGIVIDTFRNIENISKHRDILILVNDGTKTYEQMIDEPIGCSANVRYHEDRADFSVDSSSRLKVVIENLSLNVFIDTLNSGDWVACAEVHNLPPEWSTHSFIGVSATTGALADNHDILSLQSYSDLRVLEADESKEKVALVSRDDTADARIDKLLEHFTKLLTTVETLDHHIEHQLTSVDDHIKNLLNKITEREDKSEGRIAELESIVKKEVEGSLDHRITALETKFNTYVNKQMSDIEVSLDQSVKHKIRGIEDVYISKAQKLQNELKVEKGAWMIPFLILLVLMIGAGVGLYLFYEKMRKMHLL